MTIFSRIAFAAIWVFVFTVPVEKSVMLEGFGSVAKLAGAAALGLGGFAILMERRIRIPNAFHGAYAVLLCWCGCSIYWTIAHDALGYIDFTYYRIVTYMQLFAMVLLVWQFVTNEERVKSLMNAYVLGAMIPFFATVRNYLSGQSAYYERYSLDNTEPNDLALVLALSIPMAYYLFLRARGPRRFFYVIQMLIALGTILLTVSRGGMLAAFVALSIIFWTRKELPARWRYGLIAVGVAGTLVAIALVPVTSWTRLATVGTEVSSGTLNSRTVIWHEGWKAFQKSPFLGVGLGAYPEASGEYFGYAISGNFTPVAHNTFYSYLVETGVIGFAIFATMFGIVVGYALRMRGTMRMFWLTELAVWTVGVNALSWDDRKPTWMVFSLVACHFAATRAQAKDWSPRAWLKAKSSIKSSRDLEEAALDYSKNPWKEFVS